MLDAILGLLGFDWRGMAALMAGGFGLGLWAFFRGRKSKADAGARATLDAIERGRRAVSAGQDSGKTPDQRARDNDGRWK